MGVVEIPPRDEISKHGDLKNHWPLYGLAGANPVGETFINKS